MHGHEQTVCKCISTQQTIWSKTILVPVPGKMYKRPVLWLQTLPGFSHGGSAPATPLKHHKNVSGTVFLPLTPKKSHKTLKPKNNTVTIENTNKNSSTGQSINTKKVVVMEKHLNILSTNAADLNHKSEDLKNKRQSKLS